MSQGLSDMKHTDMNFMNLNISLAISSTGSNSLHAVTFVSTDTKCAWDFVRRLGGVGASLWSDPAADKIRHF